MEKNRQTERTDGVGAAGGDGLSGLEENGRRSWRRRRPVGEAVAARVSDERSEESARQDERQPDSRSPRSAAQPVITACEGRSTSLARDVQHRPRGTFNTYPPIGGVSARYSPKTPENRRFRGIRGQNQPIKSTFTRFCDI